MLFSSVNCFRFYHLGRKIFTAKVSLKQEKLSQNINHKSLSKKVEDFSGRLQKGIYKKGKFVHILFIRE